MTGSGLLKVVGFVAPVVLALMWLTYHQQQEHKAEMRVEAQQFDRDFNEARAGFAKTPEERAKLEARAAAAQGQYSTERKDLVTKRKRVDDIGPALDGAVNQFDEAAKAKAGKGGK